MAPIKPSVPTPNVNYPGQKHEEMKRQVNDKYSPDAATMVADTWKSFGSTFKELATDFSILVNGSQTAWTGQAADGVRQALNKIGTFVDQTGDGFHKTASAIEQQREAAVQANKSMPQPVDDNPLKIAGKWLLGSPGGPINPVNMVAAPIDMYMTHQKSQGAKEEAVRVMQQRDNTMMSAAMSMPAMESTPQVTQDQGVTQTSSSTSTSSLNSTSNGYRPPATTGMPSMPPPNTGNNTNPSWVAPQVKQPNLGNNNNNQNNNLNNPNRPPIGPPGILPPGMQRPGGGPNGRPGPGMGRGPGGGPGGGAGRGMGPGGMGGGMSGRGMGSFGPSNPGGSAGVMGAGPGGAGAAGAGAGRAGAPGAAGMGAGGAGAGHGGQSEDKEHKSNYLVPTDEFFDDDRMVAPPVIGG